MKKLLFLVSVPLLIITGITGCKKQNESTRPLKEKMLGKWDIVKIETTIGSDSVVTRTGTSVDYYEFKGGEDDLVEINMTPDRELGVYSVSASDDFNITVGGKLYNCVSNVISTDKFEFTATENGASPKTVSKVYLKK